MSVRNSLVTRSALLQKSLSIRSDPASIELVDDPTPKRRWRLEGVQESCSKIDSASVTQSCWSFSPDIPWVMRTTVLLT